jgi:hypothetical protein
MLHTEKWIPSESHETAADRLSLFCSSPASPGRQEHVRVTSKIPFLRDGNGTVDRFFLERSGKKYEASRMPDSRELGEAGASGF